jgi:outer membrane protein OmpA-like peptidoglycan-associated protein
MMKQKLIIGSLSLMALLSACSQYSVAPRGNSYEQLSSANATNMPTKEQRDLITALENTGAVFSQQQNNITIIFPSDRVFPKNSVAIRESSVNMLNYTVQLLNTYKKEDVEIVNFSTQNKDLSLAQARAIQDYFWAHQATSSLMYSKYHSIDPRSNEVPRVEVRIKVIN